MLSLYFCGVVLFFILSLIGWAMDDTEQTCENVFYSIIACVTIAVFWPLLIIVFLYAMVAVSSDV